LGTLRKILFSFLQADNHSSSELAILLADGSRRFCIGNHRKHSIFFFSLTSFKWEVSGTEDGHGTEQKTDRAGRKILAD